MKLSMNRLSSLVPSALLAATVITAGCNTVERNTSAPANPVTTQAAAATNASQVAEISFDKGSASLTEAARQSLVNVINQTRASGRKIEDIRVAAWADREYPSDRQENLPKADRDLADKRGKAVSDFLKSSMNVSGVDTYNMAKQPGMFAKAFNTSDVKVKQAFETAGMANSQSTAAGNGKASRAVVLVITE